MNPVRNPRHIFELLGHPPDLVEVLGVEFDMDGHRIRIRCTYTDRGLPFTIRCDDCTLVRWEDTEHVDPTNVRTEPHAVLHDGTISMRETAQSIEVMTDRFELRVDGILSIEKAW